MLKHPNGAVVTVPNPAKNGGGRQAANTAAQLKRAAAAVEKTEETGIAISRATATNPVAEEEAEVIITVSSDEAVCRLCGRTMKNRNGLKIHLARSHQGIGSALANRDYGKHECQCGRRFPTAIGLGVHRSKAHPVQKEGAVVHRPEPADEPAPAPVCGGNWVVMVGYVEQPPFYSVGPFVERSIALTYLRDNESFFAKIEADARAASNPEFRDMPVIHDVVWVNAPMLNAREAAAASALEAEVARLRSALTALAELAYDAL